MQWPLYCQPTPEIIQQTHVPTHMPPYFQPYPYFQPHQQLTPSVVNPSGVLNPPSSTLTPVLTHPVSCTATLVPEMKPPVANVLIAPSAPIVSLDSPSYQWPDGNIKLECTYGQEPSGWDDEGWTLHSSGSRKSRNNGLPSWFFRPKTGKAAQDKQHDETCHICRKTFVTTMIKGILKQYGIILGGIPMLTHLLLGWRKATVQQLHAGAGPSQITLGDINPILLNSRKARHEVEKSKIRQQLIAPASSCNSSFQLLDSFSALKESLDTPWIVKADLLEHQYNCMQTPFMRDVLLRDSVKSWHEENLEAESGRHGVIMDGTHDFFNQGILLTSLVFSQVVLRWVAVLYTWIRKQNEEHHMPHFGQLVHGIGEACTKGLGFNFDDRLFSVILDFSNAQRDSFIEAFVEYMCARIPGWSNLSEKSQASERASLQSRAQTLLIGCKVHWKRSTHKIKQVIGSKFLYRFESLIRILEGTSTTPIEFPQAVTDIYREFSEICLWLTWWILPGNGGMIFPVMQRMPAELRAKLPNSTNGAESAHNLLHRAAGQHHDI
ncbi:hypothetical protein B0H10DRAFT_2357232 [Mycena sp. CBHHK59/15]|nr:hypothetical protein B0H10DRAFT_2357232 [Mycena sp. CBHHK59/15]